MPDLTDSNVRSIVRDELRDVKNDLKQLQSAQTNLTSRLSDLHAMQQDLHQMVPELRQLAQQVREFATFSQVMQSADRQLRDMQSRIKHAEEMSQYTAGYVAMRLKEKYDRETY